MVIIEQVIANYAWLLTRWWFWLTYFIIGIVSWILLGQRTYKAVDKKLFVRQGRLGKWVDIEEHLRREHPVDWAKLQRKEKKIRRKDE